MIKITFGKEKITIKGHAEYAEHGKDILCSAISATSRMLSYQLKANFEAIPGDMTIDYKDSNFALKVISGWQVLLLQLEKQYPENIKVEIE